MFRFSLLMLYDDLTHCDLRKKVVSGLTNCPHVPNLRVSQAVGFQY